MMICPDLSGKRKKTVKSLEDFISQPVSIVEEEMVKSFKVAVIEYGKGASLDYERLNDIVTPELAKRAAWRTWRTFPCKKIAKILPPGFATWTEYLEKNGVIDKSTGYGSLTRAQKRFFWSDQCACKCWYAASPKKEETLTPIRISRDNHTEISYLETIDSARVSLEKKREDEKSLVVRVDNFFSSLEAEFLLHGNKKTNDAQVMIDWYWSFPLKQEFLCAYEARCKYEKKNEIP
jgi:hypothetical protein